ncbi:MAG TPA: hypothetical protein VIN61_01315 [Gammaproteobacteria bacterium]
MARLHRTRRAAGAAFLALGLPVLAGCAVFQPGPPDTPEPVLEVAEPAASAAAPAPAAAESPTPAPPPERPLPPVTVLHEAASASHAATADEVARALGAAGFAVERLPIDSEPVSAPLALRPGSIAVAVGLAAAERAKRDFDGPVVFCQVFNHGGLPEPGRPIWGVDSVPPLAAQLRGWKATDPSLERVAVILSDAQAALAARAVEAGRALGLEVTHATSGSDNETLYLFRRLAPAVDGLWLLPDNSILSPRILRELLRYAASHGVGVLVPNQTLLSWGALLRASSTRTDVAAKVASVVRRVARGDTAGLPALTPLSEVELEVNARTAAELELPARAGVWVLREPD